MTEQEREDRLLAKIRAGGRVESPEEMTDEYQIGRAHV